MLPTGLWWEGESNPTTGVLQLDDALNLRAGGHHLALLHQ